MYAPRKAAPVVQPPQPLPLNKTHTTRQVETIAQVEKTYGLRAGTLQALNPGLHSQSPNAALPIGTRLLLAATTSRLGPRGNVCLDTQLPVFPKPPIVSRKDWGARAPDLSKGYEKITAPPKFYYTSITLHHAGNKYNYPTVNTAQEVDMDKGWADISYHFAIDRNGVIYQGRPLEIKGAHILNNNTGRIGIVLLVDLDRTDSGLSAIGKAAELFLGDGATTNEMEDSLVALIQYLRQEYHVQYLDGHKEVLDERNCPGDEGMDLVNRLRSTFKFRPSHPSR